MFANDRHRGGGPPGDSLYQGNLLAAVRDLPPGYMVPTPLPCYASEPQRLVGAATVPLVMGVGPNAHYLASDAIALAGAWPST